MKKFLLHFLKPTLFRRAELHTHGKKDIVSLLASGNVLLHRGAYMTAEDMEARKRKAKAYRLSA